MEDNAKSFNFNKIIEKIFIKEINLQSMKLKIRQAIGLPTTSFDQGLLIRTRSLIFVVEMIGMESIVDVSWSMVYMHFALLTGRNAQLYSVAQC